MSRHVLLLVVAATACVCAAAAATSGGVAPIHAGAVDALAADGSTDFVLLSFGTSWCTWCEEFEADSLVPAAAALRDLSRVRLFRVDSERQASLAKRLAVETYPTVLLLDVRAGAAVLADEYCTSQRWLRTGEALAGWVRWKVGAEGAEGAGQRPEFVTAEGRFKERSGKLELAFARRMLQPKGSNAMVDEAAGASAPGTVVTVTASSFGAVVLGSDRDVLLEAYAPWCGHCKKLAPELDKLAASLGAAEGVVVAKIDNTVHEPAGLSVERFPTMLFYKKGAEAADAVAYPRLARRTAEHIREWLGERCTKCEKTKASAGSAASSVPSLSEKEFTKAMRRRSTDYIIVEFVRGNSGARVEAFAALHKALSAVKASGTMIGVMDASKEAEKGLASAYGVSRMPAVVVFKRVSKGKSFWLEQSAYSGDSADVAALTGFLTAKMPKLKLRAPTKKPAQRAAKAATALHAMNEKQFASAMRRRSVEWIIVEFFTGEGRVTAFALAADNVAKAAGVAVGQMDVSAPAEKGLTDAYGVGALPALVAFKRVSKNGNFWLEQTAYTGDAADSSKLTTFLNGLLGTTLSSGAARQKSSAAVPSLSEKEFTKAMRRRSTDYIIVEFVRGNSGARVEAFAALHKALSAVKASGTMIGVMDASKEAEKGLASAYGVSRMPAVVVFKRVSKGKSFWLEQSAYPGDSADVAALSSFLSSKMGVAKGEL